MLSGSSRWDRYMTLLETMQERIRAAVPLSAPHAAAVTAREWNKENRKLAALNDLAEIPEWGSVEEIFPGDDVDDERVFSFAKISDFKMLMPLLESLSKGSDPGEAWDFQGWLKRGLTDRNTVVAVRSEDDPDYAGFAIFSTTLAVEHNAADDETDPILCLSADLEAVYILPSYRKQGFSEALSWAVGRYVNSVLRHVNEMPAGDRDVFANLEFQLFIQGEAQSAGGARFLSNTLDEIASNIEMTLYGVDALIPSIFDDVDFSDFPDCGFGVDEPEDADARPPVSAGR